MNKAVASLAAGCHTWFAAFAIALLGVALPSGADGLGPMRPPVEVPAFLAHLPKHDLKLDTLSGCGLIDSASIGPGATLIDLRIGRDSLGDTVAKLQRAGARLQADLGYRGYREDLPIAVLQSWPPTLAAGSLTEGWLRFNSIGVLYRVTLVLDGDGLNDAYELLAKEAPALAQACPDKSTDCSANKNGVALELNRRDGRVILSVASIPLDTEARSTEKLIDADIRRKRVGAARSD